MCVRLHTFHSRTHPYSVSVGFARGDSHIKKRGARLKFWKESLRGTKILLCGRGLKIFSPLRGTNSKAKDYLLSNLILA